MGNLIAKQGMDNNQPSDFYDLIIIGLIVLIAIMYLNRNPVSKQEYFEADIPTMIKYQQSENPLVNSLNDSIQRADYNYVYTNKSIAQTMAGEKTELEKYYAKDITVPEFKFTPNRPFAFDRLSEDNSTTINDLKLKEESDNITTETAAGEAYLPIYKEYDDEFVINGGNVFDSVVANNPDEEMLAKF